MIGIGTPRAARRLRAAELLDQVGLSHRRNHRASRLSGGERQRVAIARALANSPRVLLADEPTGNLDSQTGREILDLLLKLREETGVAILVVTHNLSIASAGDRRYRMRDGRLEHENA